MVAARREPLNLERSGGVKIERNVADKKCSRKQLSDGAITHRCALVTPLCDYVGWKRIGGKADMRSLQ